MKHRLSKQWLWLFLLLLMSPALYANADKIWLCDTNISQINSPFKWAQVRLKVPMYMYPNDTENVYQQLLDEYVRLTVPVDQQRSQVKKFTALQKSIIKGDESAILLIDSGLDSGYELISGHKSIFPIPCDAADESWLVDIAYLTIAYKKIHTISFEQFREQADKTIQKRNLQYQNWFDNGLPMWPQETWLNGLFLGESDAEQPAKHQLVFIRPSVGLGASAHKKILDNKFEATLGLEIAGFVHYLNDDYSDYWGASLLTTLGEDVGIGYGVLLRYNNYVLGYTTRKKDAARGIGDENEYLFIGYDLYQLLYEKKEGYDGFKKKVRANIEKYSK